MGYVGVKDDYPRLNCVLPFKKKNLVRDMVGVKAKALSVEQVSNKMLATESVIVEDINSRQVSSI